MEQANKIGGGKAISVNIANALQVANQDELSRVAAQLDFLEAFRRGHRISAALSIE